MTNKNVDPSSGATPQDRSLIDRACAQVAELQEALRAYIALEHLISPEYEDEEHTFVRPSRVELGAMLHILNAEMSRRVEALRETTVRLHATFVSRPGM